MIHGTAIVHYTATIGKNTNVWAFSHISANAVIGDNCTIGEGVHIGDGVVIGDHCKIQNHALLYSGVSIGNRVFIGPAVTTTNDINPKATGEWKDRFRKTIIHDDVAIGANSTILCGITINRGVSIGAGCMVTKDCKPWCVYYNPNTAAICMKTKNTPTTGTIRVEP